MEEKQEESQHWAYQYAKQIVEKKPHKKEYLVESGITPSGFMHAGTFREIITQELTRVALEDLGHKALHQYIWDDYDRFRKVPVEVPKEWADYIGLPVTSVPDPWGCHKSYAEHFEAPLAGEIAKLGIFPKFISMTKEYKKCVFADKVKLVLEKAQETTACLDKFRKEEHGEGWSPVELYCEKCNKDTTKIKYLGEYKISYKCQCGNEGIVNFKKDGRVKLVWRVDWPMRWAYYDVDFESSGKDHQSAGGSVDTGKLICKEIFNHEPPLMPRYDEVRRKGQNKKMSKSSGGIISIANLLEVYEPEIVRYLYTGKTTKPIEMSFDLDLANIYNYFDKFEKDSSSDQNETEKIKLSKIKDKKYEEPVSFSTAANIIQVVNGDFSRAKQILKKLNLPSGKRSEHRLQLAWVWITEYAPDELKFTIAKEMPKINLSPAEKKIFSSAAELLEKGKSGDEIQQFIYNEAKAANLKLPDVFKHAYQLLLNKERGPRLGNFLTALDTEFVVQRLKMIK